MQTYCKHDKKLKHTDTNKCFETSMTICVIDALILWMCFMMCVDVLSWHFFMSFFFSMFESMFMFFVRQLCLVFSTIFHVLRFSSSCIFVSSCLGHTASVISDDLNIVSVQCIVDFFYVNSFDVVRISCDDIGLEQKINRRSIINDMMNGFGIMVMLIAGCDDVGTMYFVCWRFFACVSVYFLLFVVCHFRDISVNITSFCLWSCVSLRVDVS